MRHHLVRVYSMMCVGLMLTAAVAFMIGRDADIVEYVRTHPAGFQVLFLFEIVTVAVITKAVEKMTLAMIIITFFCYAALNGVSFAVFFLWIPPASVAFGFLITALTFGAMAFYGTKTQRDLGSLRSFLTMILIGIAILLIFNLPFRNSMAYWATSYLGVMAFAGLTIFHAQDMRDLDFEFEDDDADRCKAMYASALMLYLDFVNLYMFVMRVAGAGRSARTR